MSKEWPVGFNDEEFEEDLAILDLPEYKEKAELTKSQLDRFIDVSMERVKNKFPSPARKKHIV